MASYHQVMDIDKIIAKIKQDPVMLDQLIREKANKIYEEKQNGWKKVKSDFDKHVHNLLTSAGTAEEQAFKEFFALNFLGDDVCIIDGILQFACEFSKDLMIGKIKEIYTEVHPFIKNNEIKESIKKKHDECIDILQKME